MASLSTSLAFTVRRREPELVAPAKPTPHEYKLLSEIDDQFRTHVQIFQFYGHNPSMQGKDPVRVIREALAQTLVFYYPFAGRVREKPHCKLVVDCNAQGVLFIEADADVTLDQFGDPIKPPLPCLQELLYDVPGSAGILNSPLLLIQVTRLRCGGFIFAIRLNHTMSDAAGLNQFISAVGEMARGWLSPSIPPVWERHLLSARDPPRITCKHPAYDQVEGTIVSSDNNRSFFFGPNEVSALRKLVPQHLRNSSTFELLTACLWRCRTIALQPNPEEYVRVIYAVNARSKFNPPLPSGYYGNAVAFTAAVTKAGKLCDNPLGYALELVKKAKADVTEEYMKSTADVMVIKGQLSITRVGSYLMLDVSRIGFRDVDFGWGKAAYGGPSKSIFASFQISVKNKKGEDGIVVTLVLPPHDMERFAKELDGMLKDKLIDENGRKSIPSSL